jgi:hypothetical protein
MGDLIKTIDMDNGYYPIAKDIGRVIAKTTLNSSQFGIILAIIDQTYGYYDPGSIKDLKVKKRRTSAIIGFDFFRSYTGIPNSKLSFEIDRLVKFNIIIKKRHGRTFEYSINTNVSSWNRTVFKKPFQAAGWGDDTLPDGKPKTVSSKPSSKTEDTLLISKVLAEKGLPSSKVILYQSVKSYFTNWSTNTYYRNKGLNKDINNRTGGADAEPFYVSKKGRKLKGWALVKFNEFWNAFNYKHAKAEAADSWLDLIKLNILTEKTAESLVVPAAKIEAARRQHLKDKGRTPKWAQGWLSGRRFEDEIYSKAAQPKPPTYEPPPDPADLPSAPMPDALKRFGSRHKAELIKKIAKGQKEVA